MAHHNVALQRPPALDVCWHELVEVQTQSGAAGINGSARRPRVLLWSLPRLWTPKAARHGGCRAAEQPAMQCWLFSHVRKNCSVMSTSAELRPAWIAESGSMVVSVVCTYSCPTAERDGRRNRRRLDGWSRRLKPGRHVAAAPTVCVHPAGELTALRMPQQVVSTHRLRGTP